MPSNRRSRTGPATFLPHFSERATISVSAAQAASAARGMMEPHLRQVPAALDFPERDIHAKDWDARPVMVVSGSSRRLDQASKDLLGA